MQREKQTDDCISRQAVSSWLKQYGQDVLHGKYKFSLMYIWKNLMDLPSAQPYTDEEIQKMQDLEQAQIDKAFELGQEDARSDIVQCKECINHGKEICYFWSRFYGTINTPDDGFCHKAERRTDDNGRD